MNVVGSNPNTVYWMVIFSNLFAVKIVLILVSKRPKIKEEERKKKKTEEKEKDRK